MSRTVRITTKEASRRGIALDDFPSAGPYPNVTGMRNKFWGKNAYVVRCGAYAYHVDKATFEKCGY